MTLLFWLTVLTVVPYASFQMLMIFLGEPEELWFEVSPGPDGLGDAGTGLLAVGPPSRPGEITEERKS